MRRSLRRIFVSKPFVYIAGGKKMSITVVKTSVSREANFEVVGDRVLPTENRHSEGAAGKAAYHR